LDAVADHVAAFAGIMARLHGERLHEWIAGVEADQLPDLHSFTAGLKRDLDAVVNGLSLPYSSGAVEGNVNRIKMLKTPDVWPRQLRPAPQADSARDVTVMGPPGHAVPCTLAW